VPRLVQRYLPWHFESLVGAAEAPPCIWLAGLKSDPTYFPLLPAIVRERLVRFGHAVRVFALLHRAAAQVRRVEQLIGQLLLHRLAVAARPGVAHEPPDAQREPAVRVHLDRHLVVTAAHAPRLHFEARLDVVHGLLEDLDRIVAGALFDDVEAPIQDPLGRAALAVAHDGADELRQQRALV